MKNLSLWSITLLFSLVTSCSPDMSESDGQPASEVSAKYAYKDGELLPDNSDNEYDVAGALYSEVTQSFLELDTVPSAVSNTIAEIEQLAQNHLNFVAIKPSYYFSPTESQISFAVENQDSTMFAIIESINISKMAKISLRDFIEKVMLYKQQSLSYDVIYQYIVDFEADVIQDLDYSTMDRKVILTTTSITRHGFHFKKKKKRPRDRDWEISWGSIAAGANGSSESSAKAVIMSVVTGIHLNY